MNPLLKRVRRLKSMLRRRGSSREDAEDLVQEAFVRLAAYCNEGNEVRSPEAFLVRTVINLAVDARAKDHSHLHTEEPIEELELIDFSPAPDEVLQAEQCLYRVKASLDAVSARTREIFLMHRLEGFSYAQIADHFEISVSAIEKHIATAMARLGPQMRKELKGQ